MITMSTGMHDRSEGYAGVVGEDDLYRRPSLCLSDIESR
jgi:hypothetical protein